MKSFIYHLVAASFIVWASSAPAYAQKISPSENEPDHIRGQITDLTASSMVITTKDGRTIDLVHDENLTVIALEKGSFTKVDFGTYVGSVAIKLPEFSPIVRDSMSYLHKGFELRIVDEQLRGIAAGHKKWDLTPATVMAHGWVDDIEGRVLSIKYGPTEEEETDVEVPRGAPVLKMALADKSLLKPNAPIFAGARKDADGKYKAVFVFIGRDGVVPPL